MYYVLHLLSIILIIVCTDINAEVNNVDYNKEALDLSNRIKNIITTIDNEFKKNLDMNNHLSNFANQSNFGIPENKLIVTIQNELKSHQYNKGVERCKDLFNQKVNILKEELKATFKNLAAKQLETNRNNLLNLRKELTGIANHLSGSNLQTEINVCKSNPNACQLTAGYPKRVTIDQKTVTYIQTITSLLYKAIIDRAIAPSLPQRINNNIYQPVHQCIQQL